MMAVVYGLEPKLHTVCAFCLRSVVTLVRCVMCDVVMLWNGMRLPFPKRQSLVVHADHFHSSPFPLTTTVTQQIFSLFLSRREGDWLEISGLEET